MFKALNPVLLVTICIGLFWSGWASLCKVGRLKTEWVAKISFILSPSLSGIIRTCLHRWDFLLQELLQKNHWENKILVCKYNSLKRYLLTKKMCTIKTIFLKRFLFTSFLFTNKAISLKRGLTCIFPWEGEKTRKKPAAEEFRTKTKYFALQSSLICHLLICFWVWLRSNKWQLPRV